MFFKKMSFIWRFKDKCIGDTKAFSNWFWNKYHSADGTEMFMVYLEFAFMSQEFVFVWVDKEEI